MSHVAVDLGAGSGRVELGDASPEGIRLREVHRFTYTPRHVDGHLRWDVQRLFQGIRDGLRMAADAAHASGAAVSSVGVDSWGVDYGLVDEHRHLVEAPICYRDPRTGPALMQSVLDIVPRDELFERTGIQLLPINTLFQLAAHAREGIAPQARRLLLIPDLCHDLLCGADATEFTNATTTQMLNASTGGWDDELFARLSLPRELMAPIVAAGTRIGTLREGLQRSTGLPALRVVAPATHDTGSAVVGTPLAEGGAFISSGTWSLVGVERTTATLGPEAAAANLTNEGGAFGTVRVLKNVMGLWILESCRREWGASGSALPDLLARVAAIPGVTGFIQPDDLRFLSPGSMLEAIRESLGEARLPAPSDPAGVAKVVLDSLALRYAVVLDDIERMTGSPIHTIHIVGGGSLNGYLNQATANATGRAVLAGPSEATAIGNVMVQAIAAGTFASLADARAALRRSVDTVRYEPRDQAAWLEARRRYAAVRGAGL